MNFSNKVILITGAGSGIGQAAALAYAAEGGKVVVADINVAGGQATVEQITAAGGEALFVETNVADYEAVKAMVAKTIEAYGQLDVAINNAGVAAEWVKTSEVSPQDFQRVIGVNQTGVFYCMKEELKVMEKQGFGNIVNIASMAGLKGFARQMAYAASKHAVIGMTKSAALEYTRQPIRINAVCPVFTHSPMLDQLFGIQEGIEQRLVHTIPLRRYGEAKEIVQAIMWISSDQASFTTGLALPVDGGQLA